MATRPKPPPAGTRVTPGRNAPVMASVRLEDLLARLLPAEASAAEAKGPAAAGRTGTRRRGSSPGAPGSPVGAAGPAPQALAELVTLLRAARAAEPAAAAAAPPGAKGRPRRRQG